MESNIIHSNCDTCGKPIYKGKAYVSIVKNIEQLDHNILENRDEIEVIDSNELVTLCGTCGNLFDTETLKTLIKLIPPDNESLSRN